MNGASVGVARTIGRVGIETTEGRAAGGRAERNARDARGKKEKVLKE